MALLCSVIHSQFLIYDLKNLGTDIDITNVPLKYFPYLNSMNGNKEGRIN